MAKFQIVEKDDFGTDWRLVRYNDRNIMSFDTKEEAQAEAVRYLTKLNCDNALTAAEKRNAIEAYMQTDDGILLGVLDGKTWHMQYPKDIRGRDAEGKEVIAHSKGDIVNDTKWFELEGKTQVKVRQVSGT